MKRWLPEPRLSLALFALWLLLNTSVSAGHLLLGALIAITMPWLTRSLRPRRSSASAPWVALRYVGEVAIDVLKSNLDVARAVVRGRRRPPASRFVVIPLELRDAGGLAVLAIVTMIVPGTLWCELSLDGRRLMLHVFEVTDEAAFIAHYKHRYERPLIQIFEADRSAVRSTEADG